MKKQITILLGLLIVLHSCDNSGTIKYPETFKDGTVDVYFGTEVPDPYRWLEDDTSQATSDWVNAQNEVTFAYLSKISFRDRLKERLTELTDYEKIGTPFKRHGKYYFFKNDGLQNQSVLYVKESLDGETEVFLDPNTFSEDGTVSLTGTAFSNDGKYLAYSISRSGSDWNEIFVMEIESRQLTGDHVLWAKFSGVSWHEDGFYYSAYDAPVEGKEFSHKNENHTIYYHKLGEEQSNNKLIFSNPEQPKRFYRANVDEDERFMFMFESGAQKGNNLYLKDLKKADAPFIQLTDDMEYSYRPIEIIGDKIFFITNYGAPRYRIMETNVSSPKLDDWNEFIPEKESVLSRAQVIGNKLILTYEQDASQHAYVYSLDGQKEFEVQLPTLGSVGFSGRKDDKEAFYTFTSFTFPPTIYKYDIDTNESELYIAPQLAFNPDDFQTEQLFFPSKDGTMIPMFLTYKKGLKKDGNNPVLLYGYGGFNASLNPRFSTNRIPFLENGGIYVSVNLRGGGEYGEEWYLAGTKMNKQNVFDYFIAAAEHLIKENYTNKDRIAINGASNGGLLVGAVANQRPDLFRVAVADVGVMDMLRYHEFTIGWNWARDYGTSADSKEMFDYFYAYSPMHNIKNDGTPYPAILITTADHDDRVVPAHSFKYAAALQAANTGKAPKLIRIESNAGHGAGKPISKILEEYADMYAFIMYNLGMEMK